MKGMIRLAVMAAVGLVGFASSAMGQTNYFWNGGTGNWNTTSSLWRSPTTVDPLTTWSNGTGNVAVFGSLGAAGTVTTQTPITAQGMRFTLTGFTVAQTAGNGITLDNGSGIGAITSDFGTNATFATISSTISANVTATTLNVLAAGNSSATTGGNGNTTTALSGTNSFTTLNIGGGAQGGNQLGINRLNITAAAALPAGAIVNYTGNNSSFSNNGVGTLNAANNFVINPAGSYTPGVFTAYFGATSGNNTNLSGTISGNGDLVFAAGINGGAGIITLQAANTYAGTTRFSHSTTGVIRLGITNALPVGSALIFGDGSANNSGALDLRGFSQTVASLATNLGAGQTANGITNTTGATQSVLTLNNTSGTTTTYASIIGIPANVTNLSGASNNISLTLASTATGVQVLTGANTYTGGTTIAGGTLRANNTTGSATGSGVISITGGTLDGIGSVSGNVTVSTGSLTAGGGGTAADRRLDIGGTNTINARYTVQLFSTAANDNSLVNSTGNLTLGASSDLLLVLNGITADDLRTAVGQGNSRTYTVLSTAGTRANTFNTSDFTTAGFAAEEWTLSYPGGGNVLLIFTPTPEPASILAVAGLAMAGGVGLRRRLRKAVKA